MGKLNIDTLNAISVHGAFVFNDCDGTSDLETGIQLVDFTATMIEEMSDLHLISQVALGSQLRQVEMLLKVGLTLAENRIDQLSKQLEQAMEGQANA